MRYVVFVNPMYVCRQDTIEWRVLGLVHILSSCCGAETLVTVCTFSDTQHIVMAHVISHGQQSSSCSHQHHLGYTEGVGVGGRRGEGGEGWEERGGGKGVGEGEGDCEGGGEGERRKESGAIRLETHQGLSHLIKQHTAMQ